ncbi:helix-turn-helix domain-containing protein [Halocatena marina]|uniref:Helix-turn-helix domain-containing protein n=1 Tax=Halocatena marina TaxID=2934937 RepID=A0ABD5YKR5_9EURY|nr:helix-turn-helix domain-containing protein [Halocatena marina]
MSSLTTIVVSAEDFPLGETLSGGSSIHLRLDRVIPLGETFIPYFWVADGTVNDLEPALRADTDIKSFEVVDTTNGESLVRAEWAAEMRGLPSVVAETGGAFLKAVGKSDSWTIQLRFDDHKELAAFYRLCSKRGISITVQSVHNPHLPNDINSGFGLTDAQHETLVMALEKGYFDVPRRINLVDLADEIGVSDTAVSQRLRRGNASLLRAALFERGNEPPIGDE